LHWLGFDELSPNGKDTVLAGQSPFALSLSKGHLIKLAHYPATGKLANAWRRGYERSLGF